MSGPAAGLARFRAERSPWERPTLGAAFLGWRRDGSLAPCRILMPAAGRSGEPVALAQAGFDVTVVDAAAGAVAVQRVRFHAAAVPGAIHEADPLSWSPPAPFDAIYDQALLAALPAALRPGYAARLAAWLRPGGALFLVTTPAIVPPGSLPGLFASGWRWPEHAPGAPPVRAGGDVAVMLHRAMPPAAGPVA